MNASKLFNQKRPFSCTVTQHAREAIRELAAMRGRPVCAFFTTSGCAWIDNYDPVRKIPANPIIAYDEKGNEFAK